MDVFAYVSWDDPQRAGRVMLVASPFGVNFGNSRLLVFVYQLWNRIVPLISPALPQYVPSGGFLNLGYPKSSQIRS